MTWREIGQRLGVTGARAEQIGSRAIAKLKQRFGIDSQELLAWAERMRGSDRGCE